MTLEPSSTEAPAREPWRAANLSMLYPGLGQWELGDRGVALLFGVLYMVGWIVAVTFLLVPRLPGWVGMVCVFAVVAIYFASIVDAHRRATAANSEDQEQLRTSTRDAWKTVFLNRLLPGLGHAYEQRWGPAVLWLTAFMITASLPSPWSALAGIVVGLALWNGWTKSRARRAADTSLVGAVVVAATTWIAVGEAVPPLLRENFVHAFRVPSASMQPTVRPGDYVLVDMRRFTPRHGDVVVYPFPDDPEKVFLKRVLALPGEVVEFKLDGAYLDGSRVVVGPVTNDPQNLSEVIGGTGHPFEVPRGQVFVVGDDLANSNDSRYHGPIPIADLRGRAYKTYWPPGRARTFP